MTLRSVFDRQAHGATGVAAALHGREMIADHRLDFANGSGEGREIVFGHGWQQLHQGQVAQVRRATRGQRFEAPEGLDLGTAGEPGRGVIEDQHDAPGGRKSEPRDQRRCRAGRAVATVDDQATVIEQADADARAPAAAEHLREFVGRHLASARGGHGASDGERELGSRAEARVRRNGRLDMHGEAARQAVMHEQAFDEVRDPRLLEARDDEFVVRLDDDLRQQVVHRETETAETPTATRARIEKAEMEARGCIDAAGLRAGTRLHRSDTRALATIGPRL